MPFQKTDQASIHYRYSRPHEKAPVVTLINGHSRPLKDVQRLCRHLGEAGFATLTLDSRGAGLTKFQRDFTMEDHLQDIEALWRVLNIQQSHVVGFSMGGYIAQILAGGPHNKVRSLVLCATFPNPKELQHSGSKWGRDPEEIKAALAPYFSKSFYERNRFLVEAMVKTISRAVQEEGFQHKAALQAKALNQFDHNTLDQNTITQPTLILHGTEDHIALLRQARKLHQMIRESTLEEIEGAGHLLLAECPQQVYASIVTWLSCQESAAKGG